MMKKIFLALLVLGFSSIGAWSQTWVTPDGTQWSVYTEEQFVNIIRGLGTGDEFAGFVGIDHSYDIPYSIAAEVISGSRPEFSGRYYIVGSSPHFSVDASYAHGVIQFGHSDIRGAMSIFFLRNRPAPLAPGVYSPPYFSLPYQWDEFLSALTKFFEAIGL
ncbi:hypothetical protein FACS189445_5650 [Spirochaetia bacterium]|nr:hypothetical protein FACS189445_5650 [Spirochaetia bacterium]